MFRPALKICSCLAAWALLIPTQLSRRRNRSIPCRASGEPDPDAHVQRSDRARLAFALAADAGNRKVLFEGE